MIRAHTLHGVKLVSTANQREHWATRAKRAKQHRMFGRNIGVHLHWSKEPAVVTIIRIAPRMLDTDNLVSACKAVRDGIADAFGIKDNDPRIQWRCAQRKGEPKQYAVHVELQSQ